MKAVALVALGGAVGSVARYKLSGWLLHHTVTWRFPIGTFAVNVLGCMVAGVLAALIAKQDFFSADVRVMLFAGLLGGFTTFSAFGLETVLLLKRGEIAVAICNVALSVLAGLLALWLAFSAVPARGP
jgi:CrcB protein